MSKFTSRHGLRQPEYTDVETVALDVNFNMSRIDSRINFGPFTSSTRPSDVPNGQLIFEEDTGNILIRTGGAWVVLANDKFPKGKKGLVTSTANGSTVGNGDFVHLPLTFAAEAGRKYLVEAHYWLEQVSGASDAIGITAAFRWATGGTVTAGDNLVASTWLSNIINTPAIGDYSKFGEFFPNTTGNVTVGLILSKSAGADTWRRRASSIEKNYLSVRDWGI